MTDVDNRHDAADRPSASRTKRVIDICCSGALLLLTMPAQLVAGAVVALDDGRPTLYRQVRAGQGGRAFSVAKFRTMRVSDVPPSAMGQVDAGHPLVTRSGRILRRLKLDELPQLWSVLRGDMSLVGPRPTLPDQVERYDDYERRRLRVLPGITGWAQVNGNTLLTWPERILLDVWYVDNWSLRLDAVILARTAGVIVTGEIRNEQALAVAREHAERTRRGG